MAKYAYDFRAYNKRTKEEVRELEGLSEDEDIKHYQLQGDVVDLTLEAEDVAEAEAKAADMIDRDVYELSDITELRADGRTVSRYN